MSSAEYSPVSSPTHKRQRSDRDTCDGTVDVPSLSSAKVLLVEKDRRLREALDEIQQLEAKLMETTEKAVTLARQRDVEQVDQRDVIENAVQLQKETLEKLRRRHKNELDSLSMELHEQRLRCRMNSELLDTSDRKLANVEADLARRKTQLNQATEKILTLKEQIQTLTTDKEKTEQRESRIRKELNELQITQDASLISLETKLSQKRAFIEQLEADRQIVEENAEADVARMKAEVERLTNLLRERDRQMVASRKRAMSDSESDVFFETATDDGRCHEPKGTITKKESLLEELGSLRTTKEFHLKQIEELKQDIASSSQEIDRLRELGESFKFQNDTLTKAMGDREHESDIISKALCEENLKVKEQKAEMRCRLMDMERQYNQLKMVQESDSHKEELAKLNELVKANEGEKDALTNQLKESRNLITSLESKVAALTVTQSGMQKRLESTSREIDDDKEVADKCRKHLEHELAELKTRNAEMKSAMLTLDAQCEQLNAIRRQQEERCRQLTTQIDTDEQRRNELTTQLTRANAALDPLRAERDRLVLKARHLQEELNETNADYRLEIANLNGQIEKLKSGVAKKDQLQLQETKENVEKSPKVADAAKTIAKIQTLESEKRQLELELKLVKQQAKNNDQERRQSLSQSDSTTTELTNLREKSIKLASALQTALSRGEQLKKERDELIEHRDVLDRMLKSAKESKSASETELEAKVRGLEQQIRRLQAAAAPPTPAKLKPKDTSHRNRAGLNSFYRSATTGDTISISSFNENESADSTDDNLDTKPVRLINTTPAPSPRSSKEDAKPGAPNICSPLSDRRSVVNRVGAGSCSSLASSKTSASLGTMRHDIPHKWTKFLVLKVIKCLGCNEPLTVARNAVRCSACRSVAHSHCSKAFLNNCGLSSSMQQLYVEERQRWQQQQLQQAKSCIDLSMCVEEADNKAISQAHLEGRMTGWVKVWRSDQSSGQWYDMWASLADDDCRLRFFANEEAGVYGQLPVFEVKLADHRWWIYNQGKVDDPQSVRAQDTPYLIEVKIGPPVNERQTDSVRTPVLRIYMMAPTQEAKFRWLDALKVITTRLASKQQSSNREVSSDAPGITITSEIVLTRAKQ